MAEFSASFSKSTTDCQTLVLIDTSSYLTNDNGIVLSDYGTRFFTIVNAFGTVLAVIPIPSTDLSVDFNLGGLLTLSALYLKVTLNLQSATKSNFQITSDFLLPCII